MNAILSYPPIAIAFMLGLLVFVHEFGHFIVGKAFGIGVETFSIGFGPKLIGFQHKDTQYRISWIPLGGFVKFAGAIPAENVPDPFRGKEFYNASFLAQVCTIFAGPFANLLLAVVAYGVLGAKGIEHPAPIIGQVRHGSPAEIAGLHSGDKVTRVNGEDTLNWNDLQEFISSSPDKKIDIEVLRKNSTLHFEVTPEPIMLEDMAGRSQKRGRIGIGYGFLPAIIDLLPGKSLAREAGVQSGSKIEKLMIADQEFTIQTWDEFIEALHLAYEKKAKSLKIDFVSSDNKTIETKVLKTDPWWTAHSADSHLSQLLGLTDSQFTLSKVDEPANLSLKTGDRIVGFEGHELTDVYALFDVLQKNEKEDIQLEVQRGEHLLTLPVKLKPVEIQKPSGKATIYTLPISFLGTLVPPPSVIEIYPDLLSDLKFAVRMTAHQSMGIVRVIGGLFSGDVPLKVLGGPILIAKVAGDSVKMGLDAFVTSLALVSINLGVMNLFPIPALDGGKLLMIGMEGLLRRRLKPAFVENFHKIGFVMLLGLIVLATYNDLSRFWSSILQSFVGSFK